MLTSVIDGHEILIPSGISEFDVAMCSPDLNLPHLKGFGNENHGLVPGYIRKHNFEGYM